MNNKDYKKSVLEKIRTGEVSMRPKVYFVARAVAVILLSFVIFALTVFVLSFVIFSVHESGEQFLLGFGSRGILTFLDLFPWLTITATIALVLALEWMLRRFKFGYGFSISRIFLYTLGVTIFFSILFTLTPVHMNLLKKAEMQRLPVIGGIYDAIHDSHKDKGIVRGTVVSVQANTFVISHDDNDKDADDGTWNVVPPSGFNLSTVHIGEKVYVAGNAVGSTVSAYGIQELIH